MRTMFPPRFEIQVSFWNGYKVRLKLGDAPSPTLPQGRGAFLQRVRDAVAHPLDPFMGKASARATATTMDAQLILELGVDYF